MQLTIKPPYQNPIQPLRSNNALQGLLNVSEYSRMNWTSDSKQFATFIPELNHYSDDLLIGDVSRTKRIVMFVDPETHLLVADSSVTGGTGRLSGTTHKEFMQRYEETSYKLAMADLERFRHTEEFNRTIDKKGQAVRVYKTYETIAHELQISFFQSPVQNVTKHFNKLFKEAPSITPDDSLRNRINEFVTFEENHVDACNYVPSEWNTHHVPYANPVICEPLTDEQKELVDGFLDVFLGETDKTLLASYYGAALLNKNIQEIGKYLVVQGASGVGKSVLLSQLNKALLPGYHSTVNSFDDVFDKQNRHATMMLHNKRITLYHEAQWFGSHNVNPVPDFSGLNQSNIQTLVTDGTITVNRKFGEINGDVTMSGLHVILTNTTPRIKPGSALDRRFTIIHLYDNTMSEKGLELGMDASQMTAFLEKHAGLFAKYFVDTYLANPELIPNTSRISAVYEINKLPESLATVLDQAQEEHDVDVSELTTEIVDVLSGRRNFTARIDDDVLYLNTSTQHLGPKAKILRQLLIQAFGAVEVRKFSVNGSKGAYRCVTIPLSNE